MVHLFLEDRNSEISGISQGKFAKEDRKYRTPDKEQGDKKVLCLSEMPYRTQRRKCPDQYGAAFTAGEVIDQGIFFAEFYMASRTDIEPFCLPAPYLVFCIFYLL